VGRRKSILAQTGIAHPKFVDFQGLSAIFDIQAY
jgi:hypothetical protein